MRKNRLHGLAVLAMLASSLTAVAITVAAPTPDSGHPDAELSVIGTPQAVITAAKAEHAADVPPVPDLSKAKFTPAYVGTPYIEPKQSKTPASPKIEKPKLVTPTPDPKLEAEEKAKNEAIVREVKKITPISTAEAAQTLAKIQSGSLREIEQGKPEIPSVELLPGMQMPELTVEPGMFPTVDPKSLGPVPTGPQSH